MLQSKLFTKTAKDISKEEVSLNAQLLIRAGYIDKLGAGVYTYLPLGLRVLKKIENIVRDEMDNSGALEVLMPALTPKENWETTNRWESVDVLFKLSGHDGKEYALGATHEEIVTPLAKKFIKSYRDLPAALYQIQTKFRNEARAKSGLLRGREFLMKDLYSFHLKQEDLDSYYEKMVEVYKNVYKKLGLADLTYKTYALGGSFSKYSHEFQTISESGEDEIFVCTNCKVAHNKELIELDGEKCVECGSEKFDKKKAIEVGNIFKLSNKFSNPFDLSVQDENGKNITLVMGCYGIGISRLMGTIVEVFNDDKGIIWPESVAPFAIHLVRLGDDEKVVENADKIYSELQKRGIEVLYDDRSDSPGIKLKDSDLLGLPYRCVVSARSLEKGSVEVVRRQNGETGLVELQKFIDQF